MTTGIFFFAVLNAIGISSKCASHFFCYLVMFLSFAWLGFSFLLYLYQVSNQRRLAVPSGSLWANDTMGWGNMSSVTKDRSPFRRRRSELSWVLVQKSHMHFTQVPTDFPLKIMHVFDSVLLRGAFSEGITDIHIEENFGAQDNPISITVVHLGERINFSDPNDALFMALSQLIASFPPSGYEIEINDGVTAKSYKKVWYKA